MRKHNLSKFEGATLTQQYIQREKLRKTAGAGAGACYARLEGLPLKPPGCCGKHPRHVALGAGTLHVPRPKEPEDLIWENLQYEGSACRRWLMPAVNWVLVVVLIATRECE